jgi:hypothetical protein
MPTPQLRHEQLHTLTKAIGVYCVDLHQAALQHQFVQGRHGLQQLIGKRRSQAEPDIMHEET